MKKNFGFYISRLVLQGTSKPDASVSFEPGCNVISGASNTGKTYILHCIDFLLGSGSVPKFIPHADGYNSVFLEIKSHSGDVFTLMRDLQNSGNTCMVEGKIEEFWGLQKENNFEILTSTKRNSKDKRSISDVLLNLCGFDGKELVRKNLNNEKRPLSYRDISHLTVISEETIIGEKSPVFKMGFVTETVESAIFQFMISGDDSSELLEVEDTETSKKEINSQIQIINELSTELASKISLYLINQPNLVDVSFDEEISRVNNQYIEIEKSLASKREEKQSIWGSMEEHKNDLLSVNELITRFLLLEKQYKSDLNRLEFLSDGQYLFSQLQDVDCECPLCGSNVTSKEEISESSRFAVLAESRKITHNLKELNATIALNQSEKARIEGLFNEENKRYQKCDEEITKGLQPFKGSLQKELQEIVEKQKKLLSLNTLRGQITTLSNKKEELLSKLGQVKKVRGSSGEISKKYLNEFIETLKGLLINWTYLTEDAVVNFDKTKGVFDIEIDAVPRRSNGKGVRALLYSSFILGLMNHCYKNKLPHPLFVVLDTPVNSFREKDFNKEDPKDSVVDRKKRKEFANAFFLSLSVMPKEMQVIILENVEPPEEVKKKINYIHFSGTEGIDRKAFIPIEVKREEG